MCKGIQGGQGRQRWQWQYMQKVQLEAIGMKTEMSMSDLQMPCHESWKERRPADLYRLQEEVLHHVGILCRLLGESHLEKATVHGCAFLWPELNHVLKGCQEKNNTKKIRTLQLDGNDAAHPGYPPQKKKRLVLTVELQFVLQSNTIIANGSDGSGAACSLWPCHEVSEQHGAHVFHPFPVYDTHAVYGTFWSVSESRTIVIEFWSHTIRQKSSTVAGSGCCVTMYSSFLL